MRIERIKEIKNLGRFEDVSPARFKLRETVFIYAENGTGKTTLSSILHSLNKQDPSYLTKRRTIGISDNPQVRIQLNNTTPIEFLNGAWNTKPFDIEVFDSMFVADNIYAGSQVEHAHKKNLYYFFIGEQGVSFARKIDKIDEDIKQVNTQIGKLGNEVAQYKVGNILIDDFLNELEEDSEVDEKIKQIESELDAQARASVITKQPALSLLRIPVLNQTDLSDLLKKGLAALSVESEQLAKSHISTHLDTTRGEAWIVKGLQYLNDTDACPFCQQSITGNNLIEAYQNYFSDSYRKFKKEISAAIDAAKKSLSPQHRQKQVDLIKNNDDLVRFWSQYIQSEGLVSSELKEKIEEAWQQLSVLINVLEQKRNAPLDEFTMEKTLVNALTNYNDLYQEIGRYNQSINAFNTEVETIKSKIEGSDLAQTKRRLERLQNTKRRFETHVVKICDDLKHKKEEKRKKVKEKRDAKSDLRTYEKSVLSNHQTDINSYLQKTGTGFRISNTKTQYLGGKASSTYCLEIRGDSIDIKTSTGNEPNFGTILSEGDKSTLAFAFFLAKLKNDPDLHKKIVVIDDPISSLDIHRQTVTRDEISFLVGQCGQLILLSHNARFLNMAWSKYGLDQEQITTLEIYKIGEKSEFRKWDIKKISRNSYTVNCDILHQFLVAPDGDALKVARAIRPVLEGNLHMRFPDIFRPDEMVGECLKKIRKAQPGEPLYKMQSYIQEIESINDYAKEFHHDQTNNPRQTVHSSELTPFVERVFNFIRGTAD